MLIEAFCFFYANVCENFCMQEKIYLRAIKAGLFVTVYIWR